MFKKLTAIEPVSLVPWAQAELENLAEQVVLYPDVPADDEEILRRVADSDAVLLSYTSRLNGEVIRQCSALRYIGMCCSLYSEESANVDIPAARALGITVRGIRDYGDRGVVEYVLHELIGLLHGFDCTPLEETALELTGLPVGIVGLGTSGGMLAQTLAFMGAKVSYYSRTRKPEAEAQGIVYRPLAQLLAESRVVLTCLNKNVLLLGTEEFAQLGEGKVLFNTSIGPGFDAAALEAWVRRGQGANRFFCDTFAAAGAVSEDFFALPGVCCRGVSAGRTQQAFELLSQKVLDNLRAGVE